MARLNEEMSICPSCSAVLHHIYDRSNISGDDHLVLIACFNCGLGTIIDRDHPVGKLTELVETAMRMSQGNSSDTKFSRRLV